MGTVTFTRKRTTAGPQATSPTIGTIENAENIALASDARAVMVAGKTGMIAIINLADVDVVEFKKE